MAIEINPVFSLDEVVADLSFREQWQNGRGAISLPLNERIFVGGGCESGGYNVPVDKNTAELTELNLSVCLGH